MRFTAISTALSATAGDLIVFPVFQRESEADLKLLCRVVGETVRGGLSRTVKAGGFDAKKDSLLPVWHDGVKAGWILLVGMGSHDEVGLDHLRRAAGQAAARARDMKAARVLVAVPEAKVLAFDDATFARCWGEGAEMALSPVGVLKTDKPGATPDPRSWKLVADGKRLTALRRGLGEAAAFAAGCLFARELGNLPGNILTPAALANRARAMARREGLSCEVLGPPSLRRLRMGGLLGVGQGSAQGPRLITLRYKPQGRGAAKVPKVALVGKGITFDTGGISLKPGPSMVDMKMDMCGAGAVLGAALIAARLRLPIDLTVIVPAAENMPDGKAIKPSDVLTMANGKTVEVLNTDAEGRLILADALWYAGRGKPDHIIDAATLTGACVVALGHHFAGLMGNSAPLIEVLRQAGGETFERVWHLPLVDEHRAEVRGTCGDLKNLGAGRDGGALTAAAFLSYFVAESTSWAHVDIAGPAMSSKASATCPQGATGFGARLLARAMQILVD